MNVLEFANLFNVTGLGLVLLVSWLIATRYPSATFQEWIGAYSGVFLAVLGDGLRIRFGDTLPFHLFPGIGAITASWFFVRTACRIRGWRMPPWRIYVVGVTVLVLAILVQGVLRAPYEMLMIPTALILSGSESTLGVAILSLPTADPRRNFRWLGGPVLMLGLWVFTYPVFIGTPLFWVGYWVSGALDLLIGMGMAVFMLDETAQALRQKNRQLEQLGEMKSNFLSIVSHELRTPLTSIMGHMELLEDTLAESLGASQHDSFHYMRLGTARLGEMIDALLDSAQLEKGELAIACEPLDLKAAIVHDAEALRPLLDRKELSLKLDLPAQLPAVLADPQRLTQVLNNLLSNAIKFTPEGGQISISVYAEAACLTTRVTDTGVGIPQDKLEDVFLPFVQADGSITRRFGGSGLGLSITRQLVEGMGGRISLTSQMGRGTTAVFTLPLVQVALPTAL
ncbi:MAG TPA: HAMP domain-containing sensor histidine kinase [Oscillatoriaceae cyanobacterium]